MTKPLQIASLALAVTYLLHLYALDPNAATFNDTLRILHAPHFPEAFGVVVLLLVALDLLYETFADSLRSLRVNLLRVKHT